MELLTSLLRAFAVLLLSLQCSISVRGLPAQRDSNSRSDSDDLEDGEDGTPHYYNFEDEENNWISSDADEVTDKLLVDTVVLLSPLSGKLVMSTGDSLKNDGESQEDPSVAFVRTKVPSSGSTVTLMTHDHKLVGINSKGQILLDTKNSSDIFHQFEMKENDDGSMQLRVQIGTTDCYVAFKDDTHPVLNACDIDNQDMNSLFYMIPL